MAEEEPEKAPYLYIIVRADLPLDALIINVGHASSEAIEVAPISKATRLVLLQVADEQALLQAAHDARSKGFQPAVVFEPDPPYNGAAMAVGIGPSLKRNQLRKLFYHYKALDFEALTGAWSRQRKIEQEKFNRQVEALSIKPVVFVTTGKVGDPDED